MFTYTNKCGSARLLQGGLSTNTCTLPKRETILNECNGTKHVYHPVLRASAACSTLIIMDGWKISDDYPWDYAHKKIN